MSRDRKPFVITILFGACFTIAALSRVAEFAPVTGRVLENPDPGDWLMWRRTLNSWGYSPLNQINSQNVGQLRLVWTRGMGNGIQEATPLVYRGTMFLPNPADVTQAINGATGDLIWEYRRPAPADLAKYFQGSPLEEPQHCDLRRQDHRPERGQLRLRCRCA